MRAFHSSLCSYMNERRRAAEEQEAAEDAAAALALFTPHSHAVAAHGEARWVLCRAPIALPELQSYAIDNDA